MSLATADRGVWLQIPTVKAQPYQEKASHSLRADCVCVMNSEATTVMIQRRKKLRRGPFQVRRCKTLHDAGFGLCVLVSAPQKTGSREDRLCVRTGEVPVEKNAVWTMRRLRSND